MGTVPDFSTLKQTSFSCRNQLLSVIAADQKSRTGTGEHFCCSVPDLSGNPAGFRVQEQVFAHLYPKKVKIWQNSGYRSKFLLICTRFERKFGRLSGTGAGFCSSVPDLSGNPAGFRVQKRIFVHLYPEKAEIWQNSGYRSRFLLICTRSEQEIGRKPGTEKHFG